VSVTRTDDSPVPDFPGRLRLDGKGVLVVGAGAGIGRQTSHALSQCGARLVCVDLEKDLADEIAAETGGIAWAGDATDRSEMERLVRDSVAALGRVDAVVDIIGMSHYGPLVDMDDEEWDWHFRIVLRHAQLITQLFGKLMAESGGGSMAFVASVSGLTGAPEHAAYGAAKAGLMSLVRSVAVELGPKGVRTNAIAPGVVWTPRVSAFLGEAGKQRNAENAPLRRVAQTSDIAGPLLFLVSDLSAYVNGQTLTVDGGVGVKFPYPLPEGV
jgi:NAD(P)-dependent dehydrogenase (short-subunit alcohol dehydrogenase family)